MLISEQKSISSAGNYIHSGNLIYSITAELLIVEKLRNTPERYRRTQYQRKWKHRLKGKCDSWRKFRLDNRLSPINFY